jgi:hypothetical protein
LHYSTMLKEDKYGTWGKTRPIRIRVDFSRSVL